MNQILENDEIGSFFNYRIYVVEDKLVNDAWNELVEKCDGDIILILNDDIILQERVFETLSKLKEGEVYCPFYSRGNNFNKIYSDNGNNIVGFCFGMYKSDWKKIPDEIKLWYGDNYIYEYMNHNILWGGYIHHWESKSLSSVEHRERCNKIIEEDKHNWITIKKGLTQKE